MNKASLAVSIAAACIAGPVMADPFDFVRIGDKDGFGYTNTAGLVRATGAPHDTPADTNGNGLLEPTEFLPDLNKDGAVATGRGDDFDNRSAAEISNTAALGGHGFTDAGSSGSKWTDISLSTSFLTTFPGSTKFPDPAGPGLPNEPVFQFNFHVNGGDITTGSSIFFNLVFGDYDVIPANVNLSFASAAARTIGLTVQPGAADGLVQAATTTLAFGEVFTGDGSGGWNGSVRVGFIAPNEPYTAFDFAELSLIPIPIGPVPEPATYALMLVGLAAVGWVGRRGKG